MRSIFFKAMLAIVCVAVSKNVYAYDFEVDGIYYNIVSTGDRTCEVTYKERYNGSSYSGTLTIPETVIYNTQTIKVVGIGDYAFENSELVEINLPSTLTSIGEYAFSDCTNLTNIILPQSLKSIERFAFDGCVNLLDIYIPKSVEKIGGPYIFGYGDYGIYGRCTKLKSIIVDPENTVYDSRENCNAIIETATNKMIAGCSTTAIPESVTAIRGYCFDSIELPKLLVIPKNISTIDSFAFKDCFGPTELIIEDSEESIRADGGFKFESLKSAYIGRDIYYGGMGSIFPENTDRLGVVGIEHVTFGPHVTFVHSCLFKDCYSLKSVKILGILNSISQYAFSNSSESGFEFTIPNPNSLTRIEKYAFEGTFLIDFKISENLTEIGPYAFYKCKGLSSELTIPKSLDKIEECAFRYSSGVSKLIIPNNVLEIGKGALYDMTDLSEVVIEYGETPLFLGEVERIFQGCPIKKVYLDRDMEYDEADDYGHEKWYACPFAQNKSIEEVILGDNLRSLSNSYRYTGFYMCENLKFLDIGNQFESFSPNCGSFEDCENITRIYSRNPIPPANAIFETKVYINAEVKVPKGSLAAYQADENWRNFWNISEMDFSDVDSVIDDEQSVVDVYDLQGVRVRKGVQRGEAMHGLPQGIYIINGEKVLVK